MVILIIASCFSSIASVYLLLEIKKSLKTNKEKDALIETLKIKITGLERQLLYKQFQSNLNFSSPLRPSKTYDPNEEMNLVDKAIRFAEIAHKEQTYDGVSYLEGHLSKVAAIGMKFTNDPELIAGCYLHDTVEDTIATLEAIRFNFGERIANMVDAVTDGVGATRKERKKASYEKMATCSDGRFVKLCDRIANMEASLNNPKYAKIYVTEAEDFVRNLFREGEHIRLWAEFVNVTGKLKELFESRGE